MTWLMFSIRDIFCQRLRNLRSQKYFVNKVYKIPDVKRSRCSRRACDWVSGVDENRCQCGTDRQNLGYDIVMLHLFLPYKSVDDSLHFWWNAVRGATQIGKEYERSRSQRNCFSFCFRFLDTQFWNWSLNDLVLGDRSPRATMMTELNENQLHDIKGHYRPSANSFKDPGFKQRKSAKETLF